MKERWYLPPVQRAILSVLHSEKKPVYGARICRAAGAAIKEDLNVGSFYPALRRLMELGLVSRTDCGCWYEVRGQSSSRRELPGYRITAAGQRRVVKEAFVQVSLFSLGVLGGLGLEEAKISASLSSRSRAASG